MKLRFLGHSAFELVAEAGTRILIDPWLDGNPAATVGSKDLKADYILVTHAHGDHLGDTIKIAERCGAEVICVAELASYLKAKGLQTHAMQIGGAHEFPFGRVKLTQALHGSQTPDGHYAGLAAGALIWLDGVCVYHTGDTGLFSDLKLIGELSQVDLMLLPIGDNYTMGVEDAIKAVELVRPQTAVPMHYNTWPALAADAERFAAGVRAMGTQCRILKPGDWL